MNKSYSNNNNNNNNNNTGVCVKTSVCHMKAIGGIINHQKSLKTKMSPFFWDFDIHTDRIIQVNRPGIPAGIYLLKVNKRNTRTRCEICSKLTIKTPERRYWHNDKMSSETDVSLRSLKNEANN